MVDAPDLPPACWRDAFRPANETFAGHLPTLLDAPDGLVRAYHRGAAVVVRAVRGGRIATTPAIRAAALLDPVATRAAVLAELGRGGEVGRSDPALFALVEDYVGTTGDLNLVADKVAGRAHGVGTVLDLLRACARGPASDVADLTGRAGRLRALAALLRLLGEHDEGAHDEAALAEIDAAENARTVLARYAGGGRWRGGATEDAATDSEEPVRTAVAVATGIAPFLDPLHRAGLVAVLRTPAGNATGGGRPRCGAVALALCRLGRADLAAAALADPDATPAEEATAGDAALAEAVLAGLFGVGAGFAGLEHGARLEPGARLEHGAGREHHGAARPSPFGRLAHLRRPNMG